MSSVMTLFIQISGVVDGYDSPSYYELFPDNVKK